MASPYALFTMDKNLEAEKGIILDYPDGNFRVRIARAGGSNKKYERMITVKLKPYRRRMDTDTMDSELASRLLIEVYVDAVIIGWEVKDEDTGKYREGIADDEGNILPFERENVIKVLTDHPELFRDIQSQANQLSNFRAEQLDEDIKK